MATPESIVHIVGTGTIGEPLIGLFCDFREQLGIDEVTFHKRTPLLTDRSKVVDLCRRGAKLVADPDRHEAFRDLGLEPLYDHDEALRRASVVIDCTPAGNLNRARYVTYLDNTIGFLAQGSETGFGKPYARGINDAALVHGEDRFIQIVSCNTHNISLLLHTLGYDNGRDYQNLESSRFVCMRRANDISQATGFVPSPVVGKHTDPRFGTHHARDTHRLFETIDVHPPVYSSAVKLNSQYMHAIWFDLRVVEPTTIERVHALLEENDHIAVTYKNTGNEVFAFGRDHGHYGRLLNLTVVALDTIAVHDDGRTITGFCFTPQDGNSLFSSAAATTWLMDPSAFETRLQCLRHLFFAEV